MRGYRSVSAPWGGLHRAGIPSHYTEALRKSLPALSHLTPNKHHMARTAKLNRFGLFTVRRSKNRQLRHAEANKSQQIISSIT